jgi:hypothetical protein
MSDIPNPIPNPIKVPTEGLPPSTLKELGLIKNTAAESAGSAAVKTTGRAVLKAGVADGESSVKKGIIETALEFIGKLTGIEGLEKLGGRFAVPLLGAYEAGKSGAELITGPGDKESADQDTANKAPYDTLKGTTDTLRNEAIQEVYRVQGETNRAGSEDSNAGQTGTAKGPDTLETAAEKAVRDSYAKQIRALTLLQASAHASTDAQTGGPLLQARAEALAKVVDANSMPDRIYRHALVMRNPAKDTALEEAEGELQKAEQDLARNAWQIDTLNAQLDRANRAVGAAEARATAAEAAAIKNPTGPAPPSLPDDPGNPATNPAIPDRQRGFFMTDLVGLQGPSTRWPANNPTIQAMGQLFQQPVGMHQTLGDLLTASHKSDDEQLKIMQEIISHHISLQAEVSLLRAQLANLQSTGMH